MTEEHVLAVFSSTHLNASWLNGSHYCDVVIFHTDSGNISLVSDGDKQLSVGLWTIERNSFLLCLLIEMTVKRGSHGLMVEYYITIKNVPDTSIATLVNSMQTHT